MCDPAAVFIILYRRRRTLFGKPGDLVVAQTQVGVLWLLGSSMWCVGPRECCARCHVVCVVGCVLEQATYGFLYLEYGPTGCWFWEVEELVRKLLLSSLVVVINAGSPLQVTHCYEASARDLRWAANLGNTLVVSLLWACM